MQTAFLSPPVAMSAYYLKQVVKEWSLLTIYKGMFEFMVLQCIAIAVIMFVPSIATKLPEHLRSEQRAVETQDVDDSMNRSEEHTSELQSLAYLVCRLLLEKKKEIDTGATPAPYL